MSVADKSTQTSASAEDRCNSIRVVGAREHNRMVIDEQADRIIDLNPDGGKHDAIVFTRTRRNRSPRRALSPGST